MTESNDYLTSLEERIAKIEKNIEALTAFVADMQIDMRSVIGTTDPIDYDDSLIK